MFAEVLTDIASDLIKKSGSYGIKKLFSESPAQKAVTTTSRRFPDLIVDQALNTWVQSEDFTELLEAMSAGRTDILDDSLVHSFIEVGDFFNGEPTETESSARQVLEVFVHELRSELYKSEDGLGLHAQEEKDQHERTRREVRQSTQDLSTKLTSILQAISGKTSPIPDERDSSANSKVLPPSMNPSDPPPFHQLGAMAFQELCRDIFAMEGGISTCEIYGVSGQLQLGIDLKAQIQEGYGCEVGQCKCYEDFPPAKIREASDEFLKHIDFWRERQVRRFILFVASPLDRRQQQDEVDQQIKRFAELGIRYEAWSARTLRTKLRDYQDIVLRYTRSREWVEIICGPMISASPGGSVSVERTPSLVEAVVTSQLTLYAAGFSQDIARRLDQIRETYRTGKRREAFEELEEIEKDSRWPILENQLKARVLRQKAAYTLEMTADVPASRSLADQALVLDPSGDETAIRTFLKYYTDGPEAALTTVGEPSSTSSLNTKVALLIEAGRVPDALNQIHRPPKGVPADSETKRLHALALLMSGNLEEARVEIQHAEEAAPHWESVRHTAAMIAYFSCLSPTSLPKRQMLWPEPPSWAIIKRDDKTTARLKSAEQEFAALVKGNERGDEWRRILETWRLACLANDSSRQAEALAFCRELLEREPTHYRALVWAQVRNFGVNFEACEKALIIYIEDDAATDPISRVEAVSALIGLYLRSSRNAQAKVLLRKHEQSFIEAGAQLNWNFWRVQLLLSEGSPQYAVEEAKKERDQELRRSLLLSALRVQAESSGEWKPYFRYLERSYRRTGGIEYLLELCSIHAELDDWPYVAERAESLVNAAQTLTSVRLAANALWRARRLDQCLKLLNRSERYFPKKVLPGDLWRLKINCQIAKGKLPAAISDAKELLRRDQATENVLALMQAQLRQADLMELAITARSLIHRQDVDPQVLVRAADWVRFVDLELAKDLWRRATEAPIQNPQQLSALMDAGFALGLDKELKPFFEQAQEFSSRGEGPFKLISIDEFITLQQERSGRLGELQKDYNRGAMPLHLLSKPFDRTLIDLLHGVPRHQRSEFDPLRQLRLFIRHGGRPIFEDVVKSSATWRLHLDVSALIMAEDLGILKLIERVFKPLMISPEMTSALVLQQRKLHHHQPNQVKVCKGVLRLLEEENLSAIPQGSKGDSGLSDDLKTLMESVGEDWVSSLRRAHAEDGFVVEHMPLTSHTLPIQPITLPSPFNARVIDCRAILENLKDNGWVSEDLYERAKQDLGTAGQMNSPVPSLTEGTKLFLLGNIADSLEEAGLLDIVSKHYKAFVDPVYIEQARSVIKADEYANQLRGWLGRLLGRVREGLNQGVYKCINITDEHRAGERAREEFPDVATARDLLINNLPEGSVLWVDDRHINSYSRSQSAPIIGVDEVLAALRIKGALSEQEYYDKLQKLRAGNARYIPVSSEEILYHLRKAPVVKEEVRETPELETLRRYIAGCLLDTDSLQIPPVPEGSPNMAGEIAFILETKRAVDEALVGVWADKKADVDLVETWADWLLHNIYTGSFGIRHLLPNSEARGDATFLLGLDIAGVFTTGFLMTLGHPFKKSDKERRQKFIEWFEDRIMIPRLKANPEAAPIAASTIAAFISDAASQSYEGEAQEELARLTKQILFTETPLELKKEIKLTPEVMEWIGTKVVESVTIGPYDFDRAEFTQAVEKVMNEDSEVRLAATEPSTECMFRRAGDDEGTSVIEVMDASKSADKPVWRIKDDFLRLALNDKAEREAALRKNRFWFDCEHETFQVSIREIIDTENTAQRLEMVQSWRGQSAEVHYRELTERLTRSGDFQWAQLIPTSAKGFLRHFRLPIEVKDSIDFPLVWQNAATTLLEEEGIETALDRLSNMPIKIPDVIVEGLIQLPSDERTTLLERAAARWASPVGKLHLTDLAIRVSSDGEDVPQLALTAIDALYDETNLTQHQFFGALLDFVSEEFEYWREASDWPVPVRLALIWAHASRLHNLFVNVNGDINKLSRIFQSFNRRRSAADVLDRQPAFWNDVLHRRRFSRELFLTHGVASVLGTHNRRFIEALELDRHINETSFSEDLRASLIPLLCDPQLSTNLTGSFMGGDRAEALAPVIGEEPAEALSSKSFEELVRKAVQNLQSNSNARDWGTIDLITQDLPVYPEVSAQLKVLVENANFGEMYTTDYVAAFYALRVATRQTLYWNDEVLRAHLEDVLLNLIKLNPIKIKTGHKQTESDGISPESRASALLDTALTLSLKSDDPRASGATLSALLRKILDARPEIGNYLTGLPSLLLLLPAAHLHGMWPLLLALRASNDNAL